MEIHLHQHFDTDIDPSCSLHKTQTTALEPQNRQKIPKKRKHGVALFGHRTTMVVTLQNHSGIPTVLQVSCGGAVTHIVQIVQQRAVRRHRKPVLAIE